MILNDNGMQLLRDRGSGNDSDLEMEDDGAKDILGVDHGG